MSRSRPTSPTLESISMHHSSTVALGKLEELHSNHHLLGCADAKRVDSSKSHLPPLPSFTSPQKVSENSSEFSSSFGRKPRRSLDALEQEPSASFTGLNISPEKSPPFHPINSPGEKSSPPEHKSSPNGSAKIGYSPDQRRPSLTHLPQLEKEPSPNNPRRSRTPEPLDPLLTTPVKRGGPSLEHLEAKELCSLSMNSSQRRAKTPELGQHGDMPHQRLAPVLAHIDSDQAAPIARPSSALRPKTPESSEILSHAVPRPTTLEHLEHSGHSRDVEILKRLEHVDDRHAHDKYHLNDHLSEQKSRK